MKDRAYDKERLKHLVHYVIWRAGARPDFGATKLYKAMWFAEARCYVLHGRSITGSPYIREDHGPIPKFGIAVRNELAKDGFIQQSQGSGRDRGWRFKAVAPPSADWFTPDEKKEIDYWVDNIANNHTAASISEESHDYGWEIASKGEVLPFYSVLADRVREPNEEEMAWAKARAKELGLS